MKSVMEDTMSLRLMVERMRAEQLLVLLSVWERLGA